MRTAEPGGLAWDRVQHDVEHNLSDLLAVDTHERTSGAVLSLELHRGAFSSRPQQRRDVVHEIVEGRRREARLVRARVRDRIREEAVEPRQLGLGEGTELGLR